MCDNPRNIIIDSDRAISAEQLDIVFNNNTTDKVLEKLSEDKELGVEINRVRRLEIEVHGVQKIPWSSVLLRKNSRLPKKHQESQNPKDETSMPVHTLKIS